MFFDGETKEEGERYFNDYYKNWADEEPQKYPYGDIIAAGSFGNWFDATWSNEYAFACKYTDPEIVARQEIIK